MFAIISTGGKQYKVSQDTILTVNKLEGKDGDKITIDDVLFACDGDKFSIGSPQIDGAKINAEIVKQDRDRKILVFKKKRRKNYRRLNGHRQDITFLKVNSLDIAHIVYNLFDRGEYISRKPVQIANNDEGPITVTDYSELVKYVGINKLYAVN